MSWPLRRCPLYYIISHEPPNARTDIRSLAMATATATAAAHDDMPFWCVNVPREQWPAECPDFLRDIGEKDQRIIGTPDDSYTLLTWDQVRELVSMAAMAHKRLPLTRL